MTVMKEEEEVRPTEVTVPVPATDDQVMSPKPLEVRTWPDAPEVLGYEFPPITIALADLKTILSWELITTLSLGSTVPM